MTRAKPSVPTLSPTSAGPPPRISRQRGIELTETFAVGCVCHWVTRSGHIWREVTGRDIGIDGEIELRRSGDVSPTKILVQVKGTKRFRPSHIRVDKARSHWEYWRLQRSPVLLCEVVVDGTNGLAFPLSATHIRWVDISRVPFESVRPDRVAYDPKYGYMCTTPQSISAEAHENWEGFIRDTREKWPTARVENALSFAHELVDAGKVRAAQNLLSGLEMPAISGIRDALRGRLETEKLRTKRHQLTIPDLRNTLSAKISPPDKGASAGTLLEQGYWHVVAAMDPKDPQQDLAQHALQYFALITCEPRSVEDLVKTGFSLYAEMVAHLAQHWSARTPTPWSGSPYEAHLSNLAADPQLRRNFASRTLDARLTLWKNYLLAQRETDIRHIRTIVWRELADRRSHLYGSALHYEHAILLDAWTLFLRAESSGRRAPSARALLKVAAAGIRGCFDYPEMQFWLSWVEHRFIHATA